MTQEQRLLEYMKTHDGITTLQAYNDLGITRLAARIFDLRAAGHIISTSRVSVMNRYREQTNVTKYKVVK